MSIDGHDLKAIEKAYDWAKKAKGRPRAILAKTVKGWTLGGGAEARNVAHQVKKMKEAELRIFRDKLELPIPDSQIESAARPAAAPETSIALAISTISL